MSENYLILNGVRYNLFADTSKTVCVSDDGQVCTNKPILRDIPESDTCRIGDFEFIVCEHTEEGTVLLLKELICEDEQFGDNNNYNGSNVDKLCEGFADELEKIVLKENIITHTVDLTADDGLKDYGTIERRVSLFTANQCRKYVSILDKHKIDKYWWTATAYSTPTHNDNTWVKCVSPRGFGDDCYYYFSGVRPFCILNSNIFVSV